MSLEEPGLSEPGYPHPHVVIQESTLNQSEIHTVVLCALTANLKRAKASGNVLIETGEANLPRQRVDQILAGMRFLQRMIEHHETGELDIY